MDGIRVFLEAVRDAGLVPGRLAGLLHIAIGRRVSLADGTLVSNGVTWRELSGLLKLARYDKDLVRGLGADPDALAPRDRQRFWYSAIGLAGVDGPAARAQADDLARLVRPLGYVVAPATGPPPPPARPGPAPPTADPPATSGNAGKPSRTKKT